jgi:hypothetical protein
MVGAMAKDSFGTFAEFWPFYLRQHSKRLTRKLHFVGLDIAVVLALLAAWERQPVWLLVALLPTYGLAWIGHFFIERNRPATFTYPFWSFLGDWKMWALMRTGRLDAELRRFGIDV